MPEAIGPMVDLAEHLSQLTSGDGDASSTVLLLVVIIYLMGKSGKYLYDFALRLFNKNRKAIESNEDRLTGLETKWGDEVKGLNKAVVRIQEGQKTHEKDCQAYRKDTKDSLNIISKDIKDIIENVGIIKGRLDK